MAWWKRSEKQKKKPSIKEVNASVEIHVFKEAYGWCRVTYENKKLSYRSFGQNYAKEVPSSLFSTKVRLQVMETGKSYQWDVFLPDSLLEENIRYLLEKGLGEINDTIDSLVWYEPHQWEQLKDKVGCSIHDTQGGVMVQQLATMEKIMFPNQVVETFIPMALLLFYRYDQDPVAWFQRLSFASKTQRKD